MAAGGDIVEVVHEMEKFSQLSLAVYFFEAAVAGAEIIDILDWYSANVVPDLKAIQDTSTDHLLLRGRNLFDAGEVDELALSGSGTLVGTAGEQVPVFIAGSSRFLHARGDIRDGAKRWTMGVEASFGSNQWEASFVTDIDTVAAHFVNPLTPVLADWAHVIVQRIRVVDPVTEEVTYRLPETQAEAQVAYPTSFATSLFVTTQNSRKWYTG